MIIGLKPVTPLTMIIGLKAGYPYPGMPLTMIIGLKAENSSRSSVSCIMFNIPMSMFVPGHAL